MFDGYLTDSDPVVRYFKNQGLPDSLRTTGCQIKHSPAQIEENQLSNQDVDATISYVPAAHESSLLWCVGTLPLLPWSRLACHLPQSKGWA